MNTIFNERRAVLVDGQTHIDFTDISNSIRQGLLLQNRTGTRSAVEHMKALRVPGNVIARVLSGGHMRADDWGPR
jgi:hypothetical protein